MSPIYSNFVTYNTTVCFFVFPATSYVTHTIILGEKVIYKRKHKKWLLHCAHSCIILRYAEVHTITKPSIRQDHETLFACFHRNALDILYQWSTARFSNEGKSNPPSDDFKLRGLSWKPSQKLTFYYKQSKHFLGLFRHQMRGFEHPPGDFKWGFDLENSVHYFPKNGENFKSSRTRDDLLLIDRDALNLVWLPTLIFFQMRGDFPVFSDF